MTRRHLLGEAVFDVAFASEEEAFAQHLELGSHVRQRLLAVVDEVFNEVAGDGLVYRFDAIEIDLGELPPDDYQDEMAWRLRERLRAHLLARLPARQAEPTPGVRAVSQRRLALEQIEHFLSSGRLPWNSSHEEVDTLEQRAWEVLRATGAEFLEFLKSQSRAGEGVTRRLIAQFSDTLLLEIAGRLAPTQSSLFAALVAELGRVSAAQQLSTTRARELRQKVWSALLDELFRADGRAFSAAGITAILAPGVAPSPLPSEAWGGAGTLEAALRTGSDREIESAWREALRRHPDLPRETLRRHGASTQDWARLADTLLLEIAGRLAPTQSSLVAALAAELGRASAVHKLTAARARELRQNVWSALLDGLLQAEGRAFSAAELIATILERMAERAGGRAPVAESARGGETKIALESFAAGIAAMLARGAAPSPLPSEAWGDAGTLEAALLTGSDKEIESAWREALRRHPDLLREALRSHGTSTQVRTRLAGILPESLLLETVDHLEPEGGGFVAAVTGQAGLFRALLDVMGGDQLGHRQRLWAFTLGYLAVERGTAFSGKAYLDSLVRQSAAHTALSRREVVARLRQALAQNEVSGPTLAELAGLLRELADAPQSSASDTEMRSRERVRGYDLLDQIRDGLRGKLEADADLSDAVAELAESHPWAWSQLHRELHASVFPGASLGAGLAPETLRRLLAGHLAYRGLSGRDGGVERLAAIERRAIRAVDRARYYRQVLLGLILSRSADLEPGHRSQSEAEAGTSWVVVEESANPGKDGQVDELEGRLAPDANLAMAGWKKETLERLVNRLPGGPHSRIHLSLQSAGSRAGLEPGPRARGDLALSIRPSEDLKSARSVPIEREADFKPLQAGTLAACRTLFVDSENRPRRGQFLPDLQPHSPAMGQEAGNKWAAAVDLQPTITKSDRLLGAGSEIGAAAQFVTALEARAAAWHDAASAERGVTPIPPRHAGADDLAEQTGSAAPIALPEIESLLASLKRGPVTGAEQVAVLSRDIKVLLEAEPDRMETLLAELRRHGVALERFVSALPERLLTRLLFRLRGAEHHEIQACADTLAGACGFSDLGAKPARLRDAKWRFILGEWLGRGLLFERRAFVRQFTHRLAEQAGWLDERRFRYLLSQQLGFELSHTSRPSPANEATEFPDVSPEYQAHEQANQGDLTTLPDPGRMPGLTHGPDQDAVAGAQGYERAEVADSLRAADAAQTVERRDAGPQPGQRPSARETLSHQREIILALRAALDGDAVQAQPVKVAREPAEARGEDIYIDNAGLVLAAPYLPRLFAMLDLLDGPAFRDAAAAERGVRLLQYLVDGEESVDEFKLVLNKILCGLPLDTPIEREAGFSEREKEAAEGLLRGMIDNWKGVGHTSLTGLRETFLRREGRLRLKDGAWNLLVAPKPFDMLLDTLPWSIAVIRHRWMDRVIHVAWR